MGVSRELLGGAKQRKSFQNSPGSCWCN